MQPRKLWATPLALALALALPASAVAAPPAPPGPPGPPVPAAVDVDDADYGAYVFPYFTGESTDDGEKIHLAVSESDDPMSWHTLNGGEPVLESTLGTQGLRDPFLIRSHDGAKYYLIATDLKMHGGGTFGDAQETGSRSIMVWESTDLIDWSEQREVVVAPESAGNVWAPEAHWDEANGEYVVYWASALYPDDVAPEDRDIATSYQRMMYATTTDFVEFSEPQVWIDEQRGDGRGMIDSTIAEVGDTFYRLTKDEKDMTVRQESSEDLRRTQGVTEGDGWDLIAEQIGVGQPNPWGGTFTSGEGPTMFPSLTDDGWYLMIDQPSYHGGQGYMLFETEDLATGDWTAVPDADLPSSPRHGTVVPITDAEQDALLEAYPPTAVPDLVPEDPFLLNGPAATRHLVAADDGALGLAADRPLEALRLTAAETAAEDGDDAVRPVTLTADAGSVVVRDGRLALADPADAGGTAWRLTDAGGGEIRLRLADPAVDEAAAYATRTEDGALALGPADQAAAFTLGSGALQDHTLRIDGDATAHEISDTMYGAFYEDINYAADGGLYAELVRNRSFEFAPADNASFNGLTGWETVGAGSVTVESERETWLNDSNRAYLEIAAEGPGAGVRNTSYNEGVALEEGESYDFSVWARTPVAQELTVTLENASGERVHGAATVAVDGSDEWKQYTATLEADADTNAARLEVAAGAAGTLRLDMVSLFPQDTWVGPVNGKSVLRKDLAEMVAELDPGFLRFPGGCVTNVGTFDTYLESDGADRQRTYQWKETIGPVESRPTNWNFWGYNQSYGIGYLEYMKWAEDLGATPLPVVSVGANGCGSSIPEMTDDERIDRWVQDTLDLIEFANGGVDTEWGAVRADLGHPEPFGLEYIGLGNEENTRTFEANFPRFRDAIAAAYPDITIISNTGPDDSGTRFDELWEFNRAQGVDMVDEHYYNDPSWFLGNDERYDSYDREGPDVFLGEYASRGNTFANALSEAAYMTGLERNSDVVKLASYAPMFANEDYVQWAPDMMWFDNDESWASANYYNQKLWMNNVGHEVVPSTHEGPATAAGDVSGGIFLSSWLTQAAYDDVSVTDNASGEVLFSDTFEDGSQWEPVAGQWSVADGEYVQADAGVEDARSLITDAYAKDWDNYTLELTARKDGGSEGFLVGFAAGASDDFYWWNLGGWGNTRSVLERADGARQGEVAAKEGFSLEEGREYQVRIVVDGRTVELYLDGELHLSYTEPAPKALYQVVTRDTETGELIVKLVNATTTAARTTIAVSDAEVAETVQATELVADPAAVNTKADPERVVPRDFEVPGAGGEFVYEVPANSITFLRLDTGAGDERAATTSEAKLTPGTVTAGHGAKAHVSVAAATTAAEDAAGAADAPTGEVRVTVDGTEHTAVLKNGKARATVPTDGLSPGTHPVTVEYLGDEAHAPSATEVTLTVR
ncbi:hypothetical protein GCM10022377_08340 [Zhihengliuella alba]|uniref:non-reducing end alpha-L-arabinofuranosidase n=1 Tax=Zhihengliuella alba TaxID=547018 RepID=A0ABP7CXD7_9MICC